MSKVHVPILTGGLDLGGLDSHFTEFPFYREKVAEDFGPRFPFYRNPILARMYCTPLRKFLGHLRGGIVK